MEYNRPRITDEDVLARIVDGTLIVDVDRARVRSWNCSRQKWTYLLVMVRRHSSGGAPYRFVQICKSRGRKKVALHRIVWMAANMRVPPEGCDVHHRKHKRRIPDAIDNLLLLPSGVNRSRKVNEEQPW